MRLQAQITKGLTQDFGLHPQRAGKHSEVTKGFTGSGQRFGRTFLIVSEITDDAVGRLDCCEVAIHRKTNLKAAVQVKDGWAVESKDGFKTDNEG